MRTERSRRWAVARSARDRLLVDDEIDPTDPRALRSLVEELAPLSDPHDVDSMMGALAEQTFGLGPLESLLADPHITEVMVNGPGRVWVERHGAVECTDVEVDASALTVIVERVTGPLGLRVDRTAPFVDARLADGSRAHVVVAPMALDGPYLTIRRFAERPFGLEAFGNRAIASLLGAAVAHRQSLLVSGGTSSGKTSLLNALGAFIASGERVVTLEDAAELRLPGDHVVRLETRRANAEGVGQVDMRDLVRNALRMRPDRIIVGEVRGAEAFDMMQALNTGHEGSLTTCHANSAADALTRLEAMVLMSDVALPLELVRRQLRSAFDVVVHVARGADGRRQVMAADLSDASSTALVADGMITAAGAAWVAALGR